jgi:hypothetical protein
MRVLGLFAAALSPSKGFKRLFSLVVAVQIFGAEAGMVLKALFFKRVKYYLDKKNPYIRIINLTWCPVPTKGQRACQGGKFS